MKAQEQSRSRLGRGMAALMGENADPAATTTPATVRRASVTLLRSNPRNPRRHFDDDELEDLTGSIREHGVIQPIVVRAMASDPGHYEIIAGERRWRAAQRAGLHEVPIVVLDVSDSKALEIAIIENVQRADLNALEEAQGYQQLIAEFSYAQNDLARVIGKSRSHVANTLRLLKLPEGVRVSLAAGDISAGHARSLLGVADPEAVARQIVAQGLTVRDVERLAQNEQRGASKGTTMASLANAKGPDLLELERSLSERLGLSVSLTQRGEGGDVRIRFKTLEQLDGVCARLRA